MFRRILRSKLYGTYGIDHLCVANGHRGLAHQKKGFKKYLITRRRFAENAALQSEVRKLEL